MAAKVDEATKKRLLQLHALGLTQEVISQRLGISSRTVRIYLKEAKDKDVLTESSSTQTQQTS